VRQTPRSGVEWIDNALAEFDAWVVTLSEDREHPGKLLEYRDEPEPHYICWDDEVGIVTAGETRLQALQTNRMACWIKRTSELLHTDEEVALWRKVRLGR